MSFVSIAYFVTCCGLMPWLFRRSNLNALRLLQAVNVWLPLYSFFLLQQWMGFYRLAQLLPEVKGQSSQQWYEWIDANLLAQILLITLPFLFVWKRWRAHRGLSLFLLIVLYWYHPYKYWDLYNWHLHAAEWVSLLCLSFSVLWLTRSFADQSKKNV